MFAKTWPQRSRRLFSSFDHAIQRVYTYDFVDVILPFIFVQVIF